MLFSNPRVLPALLLCMGIGIVLLRGQELKNLQEWSPADIQTAVELNYALDLARTQETRTLSPEEKAQRQARIRQDIEATFVIPQQRARTEYRQGMWMAGAGAVLMALVLLLQQRGILKK